MATVTRGISPVSLAGAALGRSVSVDATLWTFSGSSWSMYGRLTLPAAGGTVRSCHGP